MLHATARTRPLVSFLTLATLLFVPLLARAADTVTFVPVQAGPVHGKATAEAVQELSLYAPGRVLVQFTEQAVSRSPEISGATSRLQSIGVITGIPDLDQVLTNVGATDLRLAHDPAANYAKAQELGLDRWYILEYSGSYTPTEIKEQFLDISAVEQVTPDWRAFPMVVPPDPLHPIHWGHNNTGQLLSYDWANFQHETGSPVGDVGFDSNAEAAWGGGAGFGTASTIIAILDTGVEAGHPDIPQMAGYDFGDNDPNTDDDSAGRGHGTATSGVAAAITNNLGTAGIAAGCTIMPLKVADSGGSLFFSYIQNALIYAADNGAHIASMSFGAGITSDPATDAALAYAYAGNVVLLAATGNANDSIISYPAIHPDVIGVGAASPCTERKRSSSDPSELNPGVFPDPNGYSCDGERWWGSNYGSTTPDDPGAVDIIAPTILPTTDLLGADGYDPSDYSKWFNGTSCATPYAAGVCALIKSANPTWTNAMIRYQLLHTAQDVVSVESGAGWDRYTGYGMVDAYAAAASGPNPNPPTNIAASSTCAAPSEITLTWTDPTTHGDGTPLGNFEILVSRDGTPIGPVDQGIQTITDTGLTPGQLYHYLLRTHDQDTDSLSLELPINKYAGGDPTPRPPDYFTVTAVAGPAFQLDWTNPSTNVDGSPLCDFAGVNVYRNGGLLTSLPYSTGAIGLPETYTDAAPMPGVNCYKLTAIDNEMPNHESAFTAEICVEVPLNPPFSDCFEIEGPPDSGKWTTDGVVIDGLGINPPTPPNSADFLGPVFLASRAIDMSAASGAGYVLLYQKEQTGNGESADAGNDLYVELLNSTGTWDVVNVHLGADPDETAFTTHVLALDSLVPSAGTYFHSQFRFRFRSTGDPGFDNWFVDCVTLDIPSCQPTIAVSPNTVDDTLVAGDPTGDVDPITVSNSCQFNSLNWSAAENPDVSWLTLAGNAGSISGLGSQNFTASFNAVGMSPGIYSTNIDVSSNDPAYPVITVAATLTVTDAPDIQVSPTSISNTLATVDPPAHDPVTIQNLGTGPLEFFIRDAASAVDAQPAVEVVGIRRADGTVLPLGHAPAPAVSAAKQRWYSANLGSGSSAARGTELTPGEARAGRPEIPLKGAGDTGSGKHYPPQPYAQGGPDGGGYRWIDSDETNGPLYDWVDITGVGSNSGIVGDDQNGGPYALGFAFNHYGNAFTSVRICSNGFLSFTSTLTDYTNAGLPSASSPLNGIMPFWDDFNPSNAGTIYTYQDVPNNRFIVEYSGVSYYADDFSSNTFEVIINQDGTIVFQYQDMDAPSNSGTVGIQDDTGTNGTQIAFNQAYVHNELAVLLYKDASWLSAAPNSGTIPASGSAILDVVSNPAGLAPGTYFGNLLISSNDPDEPVTHVHVQLDVTGNGVALPFCDDFNTGSTPDVSKWTTGGVVINGNGLNEPSAPTSADLNGADVLTSVQIDLSAASGTGKVLVYSVEAGGGGDPTEALDDLVVEFRNSAGVWDEVQRNLGGTNTTNYGVKIVSLDGVTPSAGTIFYNLFQMRIRNLGAAGTDDWFVDDLCISDPPCQPTITVFPAAVCDTLVAGSVGDPIPVTISNSCNYAVLTFTVVESPDQPWLTVIPLNGSVVGTGSTPINLIFDATGMVPGTYNTTLFIVSNDPVHPSVSVPICFKVTGAPVATIQPDSLCPVITIAGGPVIHRAASITNNGVVPLTWRLYDTQGIPAAPGQLSPASVRRGDTQPNAKKLEMFKDFLNLPSIDYEPGTIGDDPEAKGYENPFRGGVQPYGAGGPDGAGYRWIDSDDPNGPAFQWTEIDGNGGTNTGIACDDCNVGAFPLGFTMPFYGVNYNAIRVCSNGWLSFTSTLTSFTNQCPLTATTPNPLIAPFWDDLDLRTRGRVVYRSDAAIGRFIMEWKQVAKFGAAAGDTFTFQTVLWKDGSIYFNYLAMNGVRNSATIGLKDATGATRLQVSCNTNYVHSQMTIMLQNEQEWLSVTPLSGTVAPGATQLLNVAFDPTGLAIGNHRGFLRILTNDPVQQRVIVPVCLRVEDPIPVALSRFEAVSLPEGLKIVWETSEEANHSYFDISRAEGPTDDYVRINTEPITGEGHYEFVDAAVVDGADYKYRLEAVDRGGVRQTFGPLLATYTGRPATFQLVQNYPNPFQGHTAFQLSLPATADVRVRIFDATGRLVRSVHDGTMEVGRHTFEWDGRDDTGQSAAAGFYFLRAESTVGSKTVRMMLMK